MSAFHTCKIVSGRIYRQPAIIYRYIRNASRRADPKLIKGNVKSMDEYIGEDFSRISNYDDFLKSVKSSINCNELEIEKALTNEDDFVAALPRLQRMDGETRDDAHFKEIIKKKIISKKYFKMDLETNLSTCAAKEQIRYLHRTNPEDWTPESLSKSFPITINGVKKLLKSNYVIKNPEKIKQHDEEVEERWKALESGRASELISSYTQRMWDEGKITKQNYKSNPNLPTLPPEDNKIVVTENNNKIGEYSELIKQYVDYKKEKESSKIKPSEADELLVNNARSRISKNTKNTNQFKFNKFSYHIDDETRDSDYKNHSTNIRKSKGDDDDADVLHSQFKINLLDEKNPRDFNLNPQNVKWIEDKCKVKESTSKKPFNSEEIFTKIPKHKKESQKSVELKKDISKSGKSFYFYDENLGYQYPQGKIIKKGRINFPPKSNKKNTLYKVGQSVYDKNGEFLYKIPLEK